MGNFNRDGGSRFGGGGGGSRFGGGGRDSRGGGFRGGNREVIMHQATCAECHKSCEVPFRPTNDRPVYCKDCFMSKGGPSGDSRPPRSDFNSRPFSKPRFENNRAPEQSANRGGGDEVKRQLEAINVKLDRLISLMGAGAVNLKKPDFVKSEVKEVVAKVAVKTEAKPASSGKTKKTSGKKVAKKK